MQSNIIHHDWDQVAKWTDELLTLPPSWVEKASKEIYPRDTFSMGQLASKAWMLNNMQVVPIPKKSTVGILGCWIGSMVPLLYKRFSFERIYGFDMDPESIQLAEQFNREYVEDSWKFKGVVADVSILSTCNMEFQTGGELIQTKPDVIINTSCEHMDTHWYDTADPDQLIVMQTNDSPQYEGHVNTCSNLEEMLQKYPLDRTFYIGSLKTPAYTRFMQIGYKSE